MRTMLAVALCAIPAAAGAAEAFTGPHIEAIAGYDRTDVGPGLPAAGGLVYGLAGGYDIAAGGVRLGGELEADGSTARATVAGAPRRVGRSLYAGLRAGVVVAPRLLVYAKGGYANGRFGDAYTGDGFRVGGGGEWALGDRVFVRAEYRYSDYGREARGQTWIGGFGYRF